MFSAFCSYGDGSSGADPHQMSRLLKDAPSLAYGNAIKAILAKISRTRRYATKSDESFLRKRGWSDHTGNSGVQLHVQCSSRS